MSWIAIARKDFDDAIRSRALLALVALFVLLCGGIAYLYADAPAVIDANPGGENAATDLAFFLLVPISVLVPISAILVGYKSVVGEVDSGTMKLLLKQPHSRADIVAGKIVGRTGVVAVAIVAGLLTALGIVLVYFGSFSPGNYVVLAVVTVYLALAYVSITVAISAATKSTNLAAAGAIGVFLLFQFLWQYVFALLLYLVNGFSFPEFQQPPNWAIFVISLNPAVAYQKALVEFMPALPPGTTVETVGVPFYNQNWFGVVILLAWVVVPAGLGYFRLRRMDL